MKFYYRNKRDHSRAITEEKARELLSTAQIEEGIAAKQADPREEVAYMVDGGFILIEL